MRCKSIQWGCSFQHARDFVMDNAQSTSLWHSSWMCNKRVSMEHVFQQATTSFDGVREDGVPPQRMTFDEIHSVVVAQTTWLVNGG
jgi:hypothetical protein